MRVFVVRRRKANTREALDLDRWFSPLEFTAVTTAVGVVFFFFFSCPAVGVVVLKCY